METDNWVLDLVRGISENVFFYFFFLNVDISLTICTTNMIFSIHVENIIVEEQCLRFLIKVLVQFVENIENIFGDITEYLPVS